MLNENKETLAKELSGAIFRLKRAGWDEESGFEIRASEFFLLALLIRKTENGEIPVKASDLSTSMNITPGAVTHLINTLEEKGLIKREHDSKDRRVVTLVTTEKGLETSKFMRVKINEKMKGLVDLLGEEQTTEFLKTMETVNKYFMGDKKCK